jgi:hypothetical protein
MQLIIAAGSTESVTEAAGIDKASSELGMGA